MQRLYVYRLFLIVLLATMENCKASADSTVTLRLFLVRHGESEANRQGLIAGQDDFKLSSQGEQEARALGRTGHLNQKWWRIYSSDLSRALLTGHLALEASDRIHLLRDIITDQRLRERSYGARQGFPRAWEYEECVKAYEADGKPLPLLEMSGDIWVRCREWLVSVLQAVVEDSKFTNNPPSALDNEDSVTPYQICVFCHAGVIRQLVLNLLGEDRVRTHPKARFDTKKPEKRLLIPNTSVTVVDLKVSKANGIDINQQVPRDRPMDGATLRELNWAEHLDAVAADSTTID